jgi:hypothetical protein
MDIYFDVLTVWFGNSQDECICVETGDEVILMKDKSSQVIGFEKINYSLTDSDPLSVAFEAIAV